MHISRAEKRSKDGGMGSLFSLKGRQSGVHHPQTQHFDNGDTYEGQLEDALVSSALLDPLAVGMH